MKKIKRLLCTALAVLVCLTGGNAVQAQAVWPQAPEVGSECAIVMDVNTGAVLYQKQEHRKCYPASITKIMTTMLALENSSLDDTVTFSPDAIYKTEGSGVARDIGERLTMRDTLYAVMLESANECAYAAAEHVGGGDYNKFINMMNERARELGCTDTHFANCNGLPDPDHYTSCYDMALIASEAIKNNMFRKIISTRTYTLPKTNKKNQELVMFNHHQMICNNRTSRNLYKYAIGGKTGYTVAAGHTLVTYAQKDGMLLVCVVMRSNLASQYTDTRKLFDYCFSQFHVCNVMQSENRYSGCGLDNRFRMNELHPYINIDPDANIILPNNACFADTQVTESEDGNKNDSLIYTYDGRQVGKVKILKTSALMKTYYVSEEDSSSSLIGFITGAAKTKIIVAAVVIAAAVVLLLIRNHRKRMLRGKKSV